MPISLAPVLGLCLAVLLLIGCTSTPPAPPRAKTVPMQLTLGGQPVTDEYWWLRNKSDPEVIRYLKAENAYTDAVMKPTQALQQRLYDEMLARIQETDESVPYREGEWWYSHRTEKGKQYGIFVRRRGSPDAQAQVLNDVNALAAGHPFFDYAAGAVSDDGNLLAYSTDTTGSRQFVLRVKDLRDGHLLPDEVRLVDEIAWGSDNKTLYYVKEDEANKRSYRLYRHVLGSPVERDELLYEEKDELFSISLHRTRDKKYLIANSGSMTASEVRVMPADGSAPLRLIEPRQADREYYLDHRNGRFYIRVNDTSRNFRIVTAPVGNPSRKNWSELLAARDDIVIQDIDCFAHHLVIGQRRDGLPQLAIAKLADGAGDPAAASKLEPKELTFDEPVYTVRLGENAEFDPPALRFSYTSLTTPRSTFDMDWASGKRTLLKREPVLGDFDPANYREQRLFATATDGTKIPISLVYRVDPHSPAATTARPSAPRPMLLEGYGSYGIPSDVWFASGRLSLLDRGVIYAVAHVRGGGEYGRAWYDAGRMKTKPNTFEDFIAAAQYLQANGYTTPGQLAIRGASAGGLLIGAVVNRRPDLFRAALAGVPWVDVLADMCDASIPLTTLEYIEWGNPNVPEERAVIASYCPYTNVRPQAYPQMLVRESLNDSEVQYWDAARWVAKLRAAKARAGGAGAGGESELLLKMDMDAGHHGASGRYSELHNAAFDDAWILTRLGVEK
jgi:oligopeptidase B